MALPTKWFGLACQKVGQAKFDFGADTFKVILATHAGYVPNQDTHDFRDDVTGELSTANGYTAGGATATMPAVAYDATTNEARFGPGGSVAWTLTGTISCRWAIAYKSRGGAASADEVVCYIDLNNGTAADVSIPASTFTINFDATGLVKITAA
jgi:hypothetical protein